MNARSQAIFTDFDPNGLLAGWVLPARFRKRQAETRFKQEWKLTYRQYLMMMREFINPEYQRGSIILATAGIAFDLGVVTVTGATITQTLTGSVGLRVNAGASAGVAGTTDSRKGTGPTYAQINPGNGDWIRPEGAQNRRTFHVKLLITESNMFGDTMNAFITLDQDREWWHVTIGLTRNGTLSISDDGGSTDLDSGVYSLVKP